MQGRKPIPTALNVLRGNPGKRPLPEHEPKPVHGAAMPDWLSAEAKVHWPIVARQLDDAGVLTQMDATALGLYCETFARWLHANEQVAKFGPVVKSPKSGVPIQSPFLQISYRAYDQLVKMLVEFGMTPSSRTRVHAVKPKEDDGEFDEFASTH